MKRNIITFIISVVTSAGFSQGIDAVLADGLALGSALGVSTNSSSQIWIGSVFPEGGIITTNSFTITRKGSLFENSVDFEVSQSNVVVATGMLFECDSFETARSSLLRQMVMNNMLWNSIVPYCRVQTNTIGDFCITEKEAGATNGVVANPSSIDFVRGAKAIRLYRYDNVNIQLIAETLDGLLTR